MLVATIEPDHPTQERLNVRGPNIDKQEVLDQKLLVDLRKVLPFESLNLEPQLAPRLIDGLNGQHHGLGHSRVEHMRGNRGLPDATCSAYQTYSHCHNSYSL
ncbi:hypothetical protein D3C75_1013070 [compost metagenome]